MSEAENPAAPQPRPLSVAEINGRIDELVSQRNGALARCAKLAGENAELLDLLKALRDDNERLRLAGASFSSAAAAAPDTAH